ncbi:MAG: SH3 domain-containing protein [Ruminococcus sp.]
MSLKVSIIRLLSLIMTLIIMLSSALVAVDSSSVSAAELTDEQEIAPTGANVSVESTSFSNNYKVNANRNFNMRKGAGSSYSVIKTIKSGTALYITQSSRGYWVKAKDSTGTEGYVPTKCINKASGSSILMRSTTLDDVNLRSGAGTSYSVLTTIPKGTTVSAVDNSNLNWFKVTYSGKTGYISNSYAYMMFSIPSTVSTTASGPLSLKYSSVRMYKDCYFQIPATNTTKEAIKWSSSNTSVASITSDGIINGKKAGTTTIKAKISSKTVSCTLKVANMSGSVNISNKTYTANRAKTIYLTSSTSGVKWSSSDTSVATVKDGLVLCKKAGKAVIYAKTSTGWATCLVTVKGREAVRFTYANPNSAPKNSTVTFVAITDKLRTGVKFVITTGSKKYTVVASSKTAKGDTYVWKGSKKLTVSGKYSVVAYSKYNGKWLKSNGSYGKAFVTKVDSNTTTSCEERHASNNIINFIANYEGFLSNAIYDPLTNFPCLTVGYGRVIYAGETFYNGMTSDEAMAYLVDSVETDGYVSKTNRFLLDNKIKFNQRQFDAIVSLVYNCGTGILTNDNDIRNLFFNTYPSSGTNLTKGKVIAKCALRKGAGSSYAVIKNLSKNASVTLLSAKLYNNSWYKVKDSSGNTGYISYKALTITSFASAGTRDLSNTIKQDFIDNIFCYHHAGGVCYPGLLYRRIDECEIFYNGDYTRDGEKNKYNFDYNCVSYNPSFGC